MKHKHSDIIKAWADGEIVEVNMMDELQKDYWHEVQRETIGAFFFEEWSYRIKPEPEYPKTRMTEKEWDNFIDSDEANMPNTYTAIANEAIKRAIVDGDVVLSSSDCVAVAKV